jgi:hypothetical protein
MAAEFAESIRESRAPRTDGRAGLRVLSVLEAASRSLAGFGAVTPVGESLELAEDLELVGGSR